MYYRSSKWLSLKLIIDPVLQLSGRQEIAKIVTVSGDQDVASRERLGCNQDIGITLAGFKLTFETCSYGKCLLVKVENLEFV